jgi:hypothetical protein
MKAILFTVVPALLGNVLANAHDRHRHAHLHRDMNPYYGSLASSAAASGTCSCTTTVVTYWGAPICKSCLVRCPRWIVRSMEYRSPPSRDKTVVVGRDAKESQTGKSAGSGRRESEKFPMLMVENSGRRFSSLHHQSHNHHQLNHLHDRDRSRDSRGSPPPDGLGDNIPIAGDVHNPRRDPDCFFANDGSGASDLGGIGRGGLHGGWCHHRG